MKTMVERQEIIHMYRVQKMSRRGIAGVLHCNRKTVNKIIRESMRMPLVAPIQTRVLMTY